MSVIESVFLDDGGVMNDNSLRAPEWQRLVGEFFVSRLGGDLASWAEANRVIIDQIAAQFLFNLHYPDYDVFQLHWIKAMAQYVNVPLPDEDSECVELARQANAYITRRVRSSYHGVTDAIQNLYQNGFRLFTGSNEHSLELEGYLEGMGVRQYFLTLFGPDLVKVTKSSPEYYRRVFARAGISPDAALVVDDKPECLDWAASLGASTCLVTPDAGIGFTHTGYVVPRLADLPRILQEEVN